LRIRIEEVMICIKTAPEFVFRDWGRSPTASVRMAVDWWS
jgi:hypothetical protein